MSSVYIQTSLNETFHATRFLQNQGDLNLALEPQQLYHAAQLKIPARFALCSKTHGSASVKQELFDVSRLEWVVGQIERMPERHQRHFWIGQATLRPGATNRRISSIVLLNAVWVDVDLAHPPKNFPVEMLPKGDASRDSERLAALLAMQIEDAGLPPPTYIVATGGGLCPKWIFETAIPSAARPRWQSLQRHFVEKVANLTGRFLDQKWQWPVDRAASDASRVLRLVGSHNPRWDAPCRIVWESGLRHEFEYLADECLPYTRGQVQAFRAGMHDANKWARNRSAAQAQGIHSKRASGPDALAVGELIEDEAARVLWTNRFEFGRAVLQERGGAEEGHRNNYFWPLANALAWSCSSSDRLSDELAALHQSHFRKSGWTRGEAIQAAGSVIKRLRDGNLYKMQTGKFLGLLDVTQPELRAHGALLGVSSAHNFKREKWEHGAMGFEPIRGLEVDDFVAETRRRQALAGRRTAQIRPQIHSEEVKKIARQQRAHGDTYATISAALSVPLSTVARWCSEG